MAAQSKPQKTRVRKHLTQERLKEVLHYEPETGIFTWLVDIWCGSGLPGKPPKRAIVKAGEVAGCRQTQRGTYIFIRIDSSLYGAHRLAWLYMKGEWPIRVDHEDNDGTNNRWGNLRLATKSQNAANSKIHFDSTSGVKGVWFSQASQKWCSMIRVDGSRKYLGLFVNKQDAAQAYADAAIKYFGEFARTG